MNLYIYSGKDIYREESSLRQMLKKNRIDRDHTIVIDGSDRKTFNMESVLAECNTMSLFDDDRKAVIVRNPFFLNAEISEGSKAAKTDSPAVRKRKEKEAQQKERRLSLLEAYLKNPSPDTILIFECHGFNADSRKVDYKLLQKYNCEMVVCDVMKEDDFAHYAEKQLKNNGYTLPADAMKELLTRTGTDTLLFHQAMVKLDLYGKKNPDLTDIKHLVSLNPDINVFNLTSGFMQKDLGIAMETTNEMINAGYDYMALISMLSKRIRVMYNMHVLHENGMDNEQIGFRLKQKKGYVWYVLKDSSSYNSKQLLSLLNELAELDQKIKQGEVNPRYGFEQFLLHHGKR